MTRKEKELKTIEALGLKVGDRIKVKNNSLVNGVYEIKEREDMVIIIRPSEHGFNINFLITNDWEKVETPLKDKKYIELLCSDCPLYKFKMLNCIFVKGYKNMTIEEICNELEKEAKNARQEVLGEEEK